MDLYQLEYFLEAARQRSFTRAAARLNLAQAALSEQMRRLERELGFGRVIAWFNFGGLVAHEDVLASMQLCAEQVLPHV